MDLSGRCAVVAGVGPGLGRELALTFAAAGAGLALLARRTASLDELAALEPEALCLPTDLTDRDQCAAAARSIGERFPTVDVLVHNAFTRPPLGSLGERTAADWHAAVDGNLVSATNLLYELRPFLKDGASVVLISSISARMPHPGSGIYAAMKAALLTLVPVLARELGPDGIRVNAVVPGYIESDNLEAFFGGPQARREAEAGTCLGRFVTAREVAQVVAFLGSPLSAGVTGQTLDVNAGQWFG
ncbi:SDR family oxidoreductase [Dactylosporangium sp. CS-033363]|uniref:SDR family oxidoreductase n=1 Tax=Dactylosporangium sp. CS-033363 TaxID=3239935 RepID=UPI003D9430AA